MNNKSSILGIAAGLGAGAAAMYFLDPDRGARRRAIVADKVTSSIKKVPRTVRVTKIDLANRAHGIWAETQNIFSRDDAPDEVIEARVRSKMGRIVSHPHAVKVSCRDGVVSLSGPILSDEIPRLMKCISGVAGVRSVENNLDAHETAEGVSALQGGTRRESHSEFLQRNWSPAARFVAGTAGTAALAYGLIKRDALSISLGTIGAAVLARSATNIDIQRLLAPPGERNLEEKMHAPANESPLETDESSESAQRFNNERMQSIH